MFVAVYYLFYYSYDCSQKWSNENWYHSILYWWDHTFIILIQRYLNYIHYLQINAKANE